MADYTWDLTWESEEVRRPKKCEEDNEENMNTNILLALTLEERQ